MPEIELKNLSNEALGQVDLPDAIFAVDAHPQLIHDVVVAYMAGGRGGNASTKNRKDVRGSNRKPWRQKGTGRARVGEIRTPLWRGGGTVHGPQPRDYTQKLPRKMRSKAIKGVLSAKLREGRLSLVDSLEISSHKTKELDVSLRGLGIEGSALLVDDRDNQNLHMAARNNPRLKAIGAPGVNVYDLLKYDRIVLSKRCLEDLARSLI